MGTKRRGRRERGGDLELAADLAEAGGGGPEGHGLPPVQPRLERLHHPDLQTLPLPLPSSPPRGVRERRPDQRDSHHRTTQHSHLRSPTPTSASPSSSSSPSSTASPRPSSRTAECRRTEGEGRGRKGTEGEECAGCGVEAAKSRYTTRHGRCASVVGSIGGSQLATWSRPSASAVHAPIAHLASQHGQEKGQQGSNPSCPHYIALSPMAVHTSTRSIWNFPKYKSEQGNSEGSAAEATKV